MSLFDRDKSAERLPVSPITGSVDVSPGAAGTIDGERSSTKDGATVYVVSTSTAHH